MVPQSYLTYTGDHLSVRLICLFYKDVSTKFVFKIQLIHLFLHVLSQILFINAFNLIS